MLPRAGHPNVRFASQRMAWGGADIVCAGFLSGGLLGKRLARGGVGPWAGGFQFMFIFSQIYFWISLVGTPFAPRRNYLFLGCLESLPFFAERAKKVERR